MATPDIIILIVVLLSAVIGLVRGLVKEVVSLVVWLAAFIIAMAFATTVADEIVSADLDPRVRVVIGFAIVFVIVLIAGGLVQWLLSKLIQSTGLSGTDRFLGFLFGSIRGAVVVIVALIAVRPFVEADDWWAESELRPQLLAFEQDVVDLLRYASKAISDIRG